MRRDTNSWYCSEVKVISNVRMLIGYLFSVPSVTSLGTVLRVLGEGEEGFDTLSTSEDTSRFPYTSDWWSNLWWLLLQPFSPHSPALTQPFPSCWLLHKQRMHSLSSLAIVQLSSTFASLNCWHNHIHDNVDKDSIFAEIQRLLFVFLWRHDSFYGDLFCALLPYLWPL